MRSRRFSATLDAWLVNLSKTGRGRKQAVSVAADTTIVLFSLWGAYSLRFGELFADFGATWHIFLVLPLFTVLVFMSLGIYRWVVRSTNSSFFKQIAKATVVSALFLALFTFLFPAERANPRSLFIIYGLLLGTGACCIRFVWLGIFSSRSRGEPVAIYGAGVTGRQLLQSFAEGKEYQPVLFLDDNPSHVGTMLAGLPVFPADKRDLGKVLARYEVERVILAMPSVAQMQYQEKIDLLKSAGLSISTVPTHAEMISGTAKEGQIRDVSIGDILGRNEVPPNHELLGKCVADKVVLVTGGGGSIGSELCRQIVLQNPRKLIVFDQSEYNLYKVTEEIEDLLAKTDTLNAVFRSVLGSVNDAEQVNALMTSEKVQTVYHAAAYKHVPVVEAQPEQGVETNIFGTLKVLEAAIDAGVKNFMLISTDKAVRPTNAMGATKRIAELILQAKAAEQESTTISMVRFGNVLGSSGSVVPKFKRQIEQGGPITLTHSNITRYFMTIPEAALLVMQASSIAKGGDVFVLDMGEPVRIEDLAISMVKLSGRKLQRETGRKEDIEIRVEGLRPGEKMYEELFITDSHQQTIVPKVFTASEDWLNWASLFKEISSWDISSNSLEVEKLRQQLLKLAFLKVDEQEENNSVGDITPEKRKNIESELYADV